MITIIYVQCCIIKYLLFPLFCMINVVLTFILHVKWKPTVM